MMRMARRVVERYLAPALLIVLAAAHVASPAAAPAPEELLISRAEVGRYGGQIVINQRAEPKTLNPVTAVDSVSREIRNAIADYPHQSRDAAVEPRSPGSWTASPDGRRYTVVLRRGIRFSDGHSFDADDVLFSFRVYLDDKVRSRQRDVLTIGGQPVGVRKVDPYTVQVELAEPYAGAERLLDGVAMLPRHLLESSFTEGGLADAWGLATPAAQMAGTGPFRFKETCRAGGSCSSGTLTTGRPTGQPPSVSSSVRPSRATCRRSQTRGRSCLTSARRTSAS